MKKIFIVMILLLSLLSCSNKKIDTFIGNILIDETLLVNYNSDFVINNLSAKSLLMILEDNMKNEEKQSNVKKVISSSDNIYLYIGMFDFLRCVSLNSNQLEFSFKESILEIFEIHLFHIIEKIYEYKKDINITLFTLFNPYLVDQSTFYINCQMGIEKFNQVIINMAKENQLKVIDLINYSSRKDVFNQLDIDSQKEILELIQI